MRAVVGQLEEARLRAVGAGERTAIVTEQLRLDQLARQPRAVELDQGLVATRAVAVEPARQVALAGAGVAEDQHRDRDLRGPLADLADGGRQRQGRVRQRGRPPAARGRRHPLVAPLLEDPGQDHGQGRQLDRLGQEVPRALADGAHHQIDRAEAGDHDDAQVRAGGDQGPHQLDAVAVGQAVVDHRQIEVAGGDRRSGLGAGPGHRHAIAQSTEIVGHREPDDVIVLDDQQPGGHVGPSAGSSTVTKAPPSG
jgi:hypothetical protein